MTIATAANSNQMLGIHPILFTEDIARTVQYYQDVLGFQKDWEYGDPVFYASVTREGITFHFRQIEPPILHNHRNEIDTVDYYITVSDVDLVYSELLNSSANIVYGPVSQEYGMREFYIEDCGGYRIGFGQRLS